MRGHVEKRWDSSYTLVVDFGTDPATGKRKRRTHNVKVPDEDAAYAALYRWMAELADGTYVEPTKMTLTAWLYQWLAQADLAPKTRHGYAGLIERHIIPHIGALKLSDVRPIHLQNLYGKLLSSDRKDGKDGGLSANTVAQIHAILHRAFQVAFKLQLVKMNPASVVDKPRPRRPEVVILSREQRDLLLKEAAKTPFYLPVLLAVRLGLRRGEALALRWSDIDFGKGLVTVRAALGYTPEDGVYEGEPKRGSRRRLPLPKDVAEALAKHRHEQKKRRLAAGPAWHDLDLVCDAGDGRPWFPDSISTWCPRFTESIGLPRLRFHDLRHNYAADMIEQGLHPKVIQMRMGHSSIVVTMDIYGHLMPTL